MQPQPTERGTAAHTAVHAPNSLPTCKQAIIFKTVGPGPQAGRPGDALLHSLPCKGRDGPAQDGSHNGCSNPD